jgi:hypothetical protein
MAKTPRKRTGREDANEAAYRTLQEAIGEAPKTEPPGASKLTAAVELGRRGGLVGGKARAKALSPAKRRAIARKAAAARWGEN